VLRWACGAVAALAVAGAASAADAPHVQRAIVPGQAIGKVRLGMSLAQVRKVLGRPEAVISRRKGVFGRERVEYSWNFTEWRIMFEVGRGQSEAVSIRSSIRNEKTKEGIGVGTLQQRLERTYGIECADAFQDQGPFGGGTFIGRACVLEQNRRKTSFLVYQFCGNVPTAGSCAERDRRWAVGEVGVFAPGENLPW
jgi:hypothetical protein